MDPRHDKFQNFHTKNLTIPTTEPINGLKNSNP